MLYVPHLSVYFFRYIIVALCAFRHFCQNLTICQAQVEGLVAHSLCNPVCRIKINYYCPLCWWIGIGIGISVGNGIRVRNSIRSRIGLNFGFFGPWGDVPFFCSTPDQDFLSGPRPEKAAQSSGRGVKLKLAKLSSYASGQHAWPLPERSPVQFPTLTLLPLRAYNVKSVT